ncbi:MAG TPA: CRTAC1 family protein [Pirellulaceae bacterium]|nr:CRTAC1 family protein [Pirellulaceae bacterium]
MSKTFATGAIMIAVLIAVVATSGCRGAATDSGADAKSGSSGNSDGSKQATNDGGAARDAKAGSSPARRAPGFRDTARDAGIKFKMNFLPGEQGLKFKINLYDHGCGLAIGDYDGDGRDDIYFLNQLGPNALYRNKGDGTFEDVTEKTGVALDDRISVGATFADYDNDGDQDLYVTSTRGGNVLFRNEGGEKFVDVTDEAGLKHVGHSQTAVFFDYDRDGKLDLFLVQTSDWTTSTFNERERYFVGKGGDEGGLEAVLGAPKEFNVLYHNEGGGKFADVTEKAGLKGRGWAGDVAAFDYDEDGWLDLFVACMFGRAQLYRNRRDGTFEDVTLDVLGPTPFGGIGAKAFDFNNDGHLDLYCVDMHSDMWMGLDVSQSSLAAAKEAEKVKFKYFYGPKVDGSPMYEKLEQEAADLLGIKHEEVLFGNALYKNLGGGKFREMSAEADAENFWPWSIATGDFDNDGHEDAFVATGMGYPFYYWHNYLLMNTGREAFVDKSYALGIEPPSGGNFLSEPFHGTKYARSSRCAATADFDGDGRVEIVTNNFNHEPYFFRNELPKKHYVALRLRGVRSNRDAVGAVVRIVDGERTLTRQVHAAGGYLSHSSKTLHFGLGDSTKVPKLEVTWPDGRRQVVENLDADRLHELVEPEQATP